MFSHDKVGRRFPLIALIEGADFPPPTVVPEQRWYAALEALMLERGNAYFELLVESLSRLFHAERVFVALQHVV